jgi:hypothetical protein
VVEALERMDLRWPGPPAELDALRAALRR